MIFVIWLTHLMCGSFICVTWLIHMCDMTHSYLWLDSFIWWHIITYHMICVTFICVTWSTHFMSCNSYEWWHIITYHIICVTWSTHFMSCNSYVTWFIYLNDITHSYVSYICDMTYHVNDMAHPFRKFVNVDKKLQRFSDGIAGIDLLLRRWILFYIHRNTLYRHPCLDSQHESENQEKCERKRSRFRDWHRHGLSNREVLVYKAYIEDIVWRFELDWVFVREITLKDAYVAACKDQCCIPCTHVYVFV